jgi:hypothetical protein
MILTAVSMATQEIESGFFKIDCNDPGETDLACW